MFSFLFSEGSRKRKIDLPSGSGAKTYPYLLSEKEAFLRNYVERVFSIDNIDPTTVIRSNRSFFRKELKKYFSRLENSYVYVKIKANLVFETEKQNITNNSSDVKSFVLSLNSLIINTNEIDKLLDVWQENIATLLPNRLQRLEGSGNIIKKCLTFNILFLRQSMVNAPGAEHIHKLPKIRGVESLFNPTGVLNSCLVQCLAAYVAINHKGKNIKDLSRHLNDLSRCGEYVF